MSPAYHTCGKCQQVGGTVCTHPPSAPLGGVALSYLRCNPGMDFFCDPKNAEANLNPLWKLQMRVFRFALHAINVCKAKPYDLPDLLLAQ